MPKLKKKSSFFRPIHLKALLLLFIYTILSKTILFKSIVSSKFEIWFLGPLVFGVLTAYGFLYLFSHEDFFHFVKEIEREESSKEKRLLHKHLHFGKVLAVVTISAVGGTILAALTTRILLNKYKFKYIVLLISMFISTIVSVGFAKGVFINLFK